MIPERDDHIRHRKNRGSAGARPSKMETDLNKRRTVVEHSFKVNMQWLARATRHDKHAINSRAGVVLFAVIAWLKALLGSRRPGTQG